MKPEQQRKIREAAATRHRLNRKGSTMFEVTINQLKRAGACTSGYLKVLKANHGIGKNAPISLLSILESNGLNDAIWALRCVNSSDRDNRLFAVWCARQVEHLMKDQRGKQALGVAEKYANGEATQGELLAARAAAADAYADARSTARSTAAVVATAAYAVAYAATDAYAYAAAYAAAAADADARSTAADAADARSAAATDARSAARSAQKEMFIKMCKGEAPWQI